MVDIVTISVLTLLNVLLISCSPIELQDSIPVNKLTYDEMISQAKSVGDGSTVAGVRLPTLSSLGEFNGKHFYIGRNLANLQQAKADCASFGFSLAKANQAELNFLFSVTTYDDDYSWVGAHVPESLGVFRWSYDNSDIQSGILLSFYFLNTSIGLSIDRYPDNSRLIAFSTDTLHYYFCMM